MLSYAGIAAAYALAATALVLAGMALARWPLERKAWPALALVLFLIALALHPFPDPATFDCRTQAVPPRFLPLRWLDTIAELRAVHARPVEWLQNLMVASTVMNLALSLAIGVALAPLRLGFGAVFLFGMCLSLGIEVAQLTGFFGLYGCPYRQFDVDDLILNVGGILAGFWIARRLYRSGAM
jgi:VanZ like family